MIQSLHALRFIFALMVFMSHLNYVIPPENKFWSFLYRYIFREGYIGVSFFFILSGYILAYRYIDSIREQNFSFKTFINRRFARILPMYYVGLLVALPLSYSELIHGNTIFYFKKLITNIFLFQSFIPINDYYFSFNGVSWSISTELFFYVCFPFIAAFLIKQKSIKKLLLGIFLIILSFGILWIGNDHAYYWLYISPIFRIADFSIGIGLFLLLKNYDFKVLKKEGTKWEYGAISLFLLFLIIQPHVHANFKVSIFYWIPICAIIAVFSTSNGNIVQMLSQNIWKHLGHLSFSFYLLHHSYFKYFEVYIKPLTSEKWTGFYILLLLLLSIFTSHITYRYIEEPARKFIRSKSS